MAAGSAVSGSAAPESSGDSVQPAGEATKAETVGHASSTLGEGKDKADQFAAREPQDEKESALGGGTSPAEGSTE